jgi:hypothetical protein
VRSRLVRGYLAGLTGTAVMTATLTAEKRLRAATPGPVDYDASPHVVTAASAVLHVQPRSAWQRRALFLLVHWGYGSAVGIGYDLLRSRVPARTAAVVFFAGCQTMACTLFPVFGGTPPPWRWRPSLLASSLVQHAIYAAVVAETDERLRR